MLKTQNTPPEYLTVYEHNKHKNRQILKILKKDFDYRRSIKEKKNAQLLRCISTIDFVFEMSLIIMQIA